MIGSAASSRMLSASDFRGVWLRVTLTTESSFAFSVAPETLCRLDATVFGEASAAFTKSALVAFRRSSVEAEATVLELRVVCLRLDAVDTRSVPVTAAEDRCAEVVFLLERAFALALEECVVRWAAERRAFRAGAASSADAGNSNAKARRAEMGA